MRVPVTFALLVITMTRKERLPVSRVLQGGQLRIQGLNRSQSATVRVPWFIMGEFYNHWFHEFSILIEKPIKLITVITYRATLFHYDLDFFLAAICPAGQYAEDVTNVCKNCPLGYYQELSGSRMCRSCPNGQVTLQEGATSLEQCQGGYLFYLIVFEWIM